MPLKRLFPAFVLLIPGLLWAQIGAQKTPPTMTHLSDPGGRQSMHIQGSDSLLSPTAWKVVSKTPFTQLARVDTLRFISSSTEDSCRLTVYGVQASDSANVKMTIRISGQDSVFGPKASNEGTAKRFKYFAYAVLDTEAAGTIKILGKTSGVVTTIRPGFLQTEVVHHFTGRNGTEIRGWGAEADTTSPIEVELRFYPDFADSRETPETGKRILVHKLLRTAAGDARAYEVHFPSGSEWFVHGGGYLAVMDRGTNSKILDAFLDVADK